jgi:hypothetical protein
MIPCLFLTGFIDGISTGIVFKRPSSSSKGIPASRKALIIMSPLMPKMGSIKSMFIGG